MKNKMVLSLSFLVSFLTLNIAFAQSKLDSLQQIVETTKDTSASVAYYEIGKIIAGTSMDSSVQYFEKGAALAEKLNFSNGKILNWRSLGSVLGRSGKYEEALQWLEKGLLLIEKENLPISNKVDFIINTGAAHYYAGFTGKAIESYIEAVEICRNHGFDSKRGMLLNNLGIFYRSLDRYEEAIKIYDESYELRHQLKDSMGMGNIAFNRAAVYGKMKEYDNALESISEATSIFVNLKSENDIKLCKLATGSFLIDLERYDEAEPYLLPLSVEKDLPFELIHLNNLHMGLAKIKIHRKQYKQAIQHIDIIEEKLMDSELSKEKADLSLAKAKALEKINATVEANKYLNQYIQIFGERSNIESQELLREMETKYLTKEKDAEIALLNSESELKNIKLKAANQRNIFLGIGMIILGLFTIMLYRLYKKVENQNIIISKSNKEKAILLQEIHHRVKNNLQVVSSLLGLQSRFVEDDSALAAIKTGRARVQSMSLLHQNVYKNENLKSVNIKKYFEDLGNNLFTNYRLDEKEIEFITDIDDLELDIDVVVPMGLITNELISNSLKYAFIGREKGSIFLSIKETQGEIILEVKDDGVGIPFTELPERSKSLGMQLVKSFAHKLQATVAISNHQGTQISLKFDPKAIVVAAA